MEDPPDLDERWTRTPPAARAREAIVCGVLGPLMDLYTRRSLVGVERLDALDGPVVFVANHSSHMDTPAILRALPRRWRRRTAVAAASDYFYNNRRNALSASFVFGTIPVDRSGGGLGPRSAGHLDRLVAGGGSLLMFAEGTRSHDGGVARLRSGAAVLAARHRVPLVPICVGGTGEAMPRGHKWMVFRGGRPGRGRHRISIRVGAPIDPSAAGRPDDAMEQVRRFLAASGARTEPPRAVPAPRARLHA